MATINPFYRFEDAIQVGSLGERGFIVSQALDNIFGLINIGYVGQTLQQVLSYINPYINEFNGNLQANIVLKKYYSVSLTQAYPVQIFIYDTILAEFYPLMKISLSLVIDTNGLVINNTAYFLGATATNYNYSEPLCDDERQAYRALISMAETGSAIFPKTYQFDSVTGVASSLFPRLRPCQYDISKGTATRFPADTYARAARPAIKFSSLSPIGKVCVGLWNRAIEIANTTGATITDIYNDSYSWSVPDGYTVYSVIDSVGIERLQIEIKPMDYGGEGFTLLVIDDNGFKMQRFYAPIFSPFDFLANFPYSTSMPYQPDVFYMYGGIYYDYDFCEFQDCQFPQKEVYPMPVKSGDELQFNVLPYQSNVLPYDSVDIGIFDSNFNLVQKIGETSKLSDITCTNLLSTCSHNFIGYFDFTDYFNLLDDYGIYVEATNSYYVTLIFEIKNSANEVVTTLTGIGAWSNILSGQVIATWFPPIGIEYDYDVDSLSYYALNLPCGDTYTFTHRIIASNGNNEIFVTEPFECVCQTSTIVVEQQNAKTLIPALKNGCYRFGLYNFKQNFNGSEIEFSDGYFPIADNQYNVIVITDDATLTTVKYLILIPYKVNTIAEYVTYLNKVFPNSAIITNTGDILFKLCGYNSSFTPNDLFAFGTYDFNTSTFTYINIGATAAIPCFSGEEQEPINEIYSFSNPIDLDNYECFSSIIQFWADSNAIAEGFEYYDGWYQQIRLGINGGGKKPVITESTYRQSNGVTRRPQNKQDLSIDLHTDFLDFETQSALVDATRHSNFVVAGQNLFVNGEIEVATVQDFTTQTSFEDLAQVKFSALVQGYQPKNSTCVNC
jgi:hypothetical protein